jgi:hypothetical protein
VEEFSTWLAATLPARAGADADAIQVADALISILQDVDVALTPTLGRSSVSLIYQRCFRVQVQPWMAGALEGIGAETDLATLQSAFAQQSSADAVEGGMAFLQAFYEMLVGCIGHTMTEALLRPVWANHPRRRLAVGEVTESAALTAQIKLAPRPPIKLH